MCGICGYVSKTEYSGTILKEMNDTLVHRGPDDAGIFQGYLKTGEQLGLAQRRLSIVDLSEAGHQPMFSKDNRYAIVYNGEVYNFTEWRKELERKGYCFRSKCDTEVILYLYQEFGLDFLSKLNGMFAIAIMDFENEQLLLARDRMGKKPLYFYFLENNCFVFASELKAIMKFPGFHKSIRTELVSSYLVNKCFDSPSTVFENTYKVEPGQVIVWQEGGIRKVKFWDLLKKYRECSENVIEDYNEAKRELKHLLLDSVSKRMIADVDVGTFLSGGIDSTLITACAREVSDEPIRTFTIGFHTKDENEAEYAKEIAKYLGTEHTERYIHSKDLFEQIKGIAKFYDEPFSDSSQIPSMLVSKLAKEGATVILSGDGGDELFCGYEEYDWLKAIHYLDKLGSIGYAVLNTSILKRANILNRLPDKAYAFFCNRDSETKVQLFNDVRERYTHEMIQGDSVSSKRSYEREIKQIALLENDWQTQKMLLDMRYYLADEVLVKMDRASMKYSLEVRCPLLDYRIVEYSLRMPLAYKYYKREKKYILKDVLYGMVPKELLDRPKRGFGVPLVQWMRNELYGSLMRYADKKILEKQGIFRAEKIHEFIYKMMISDISVYNSVLWGFLMFQMWYQEHVEDLWEI